MFLLALNVDNKNRAPPTAQHTHAHITCKSHGFMHNVRLLTTPAVVQIHDCSLDSLSPPPPLPPPPPPSPPPPPPPPDLPTFPQHTRIHSHTWYTLFSIQWNPSHAYKQLQSHAQVIQDVYSRLWRGELFTWKWKERSLRRERRKTRWKRCGMWSWTRCLLR